MLLLNSTKATGSKEAAFAEHIADAAGAKASKMDIATLFAAGNEHSGYR